MPEGKPKRKIALLTSRVPWPLDKGDKLRAYYLLRELSKDYDVALFSLSEDKVAPEAHAELQRYCSRVYFFSLTRVGRWFHVLLAFLNGKPLQTGYFLSLRHRAELRRLLASWQPDALFSQLVRMAEYVDKDLKTIKVLDFQDALSAGLQRRAAMSPLFMRALLHLEYRRMRAYEQKMYRFFDRYAIISEADRQLLPGAQRKEVQVIPNGVDTEHFHPVGGKVTPATDIVFTGNMSYPPNVDASRFLVRHIMPLVWAEYPHLTLTLAGANPAPAVRQLASGRVRVTGWVDDMAEVYRSARLFIAPMRMGTGLQNKLLEAMASGLPAITTTLANKALGAVHQQNILVGDDAEMLSRHLLRLLDDKTFAAEMAGRGRRFVVEHYSWAHVGQSVKKLIFGHSVED